MASWSQCSEPLSRQRITTLGTRQNNITDVTSQRANEDKGMLRVLEASLQACPKVPPTWLCTLKVPSTPNTATFQTKHVGQHPNYSSSFQEMIELQISASLKLETAVQFALTGEEWQKRHWSQYWISFQMPMLRYPESKDSRHSGTPSALTDSKQMCGRGSKQTFTIISREDSEVICYLGIIQPLLSDIEVKSR